MAATATSATTRTRIHVAGLGQSVSSDDIWKVFSTVGTVEGMDIIRTKGRSFAYVDILPSSSNSLSKLFSTYNGCVWKGDKLKLEKAKDHFLTRLKREWAETEAEAARHQPMSSSSDNPYNNVSQNNHLRIFFPRLSKVKSLPLSGTGKHRYSFQRVETPVLPIHFCDCEEHSGHFNAVKQKEVQHHEEINGAMNEKELSLMCSVMNKLFERGNVSNTSRAVVKPVEDSLCNEEDEDDDDLIINVVSNAINRAAMSGSGEQEKISTEKTRLGENQISKDGAIQSAGKVQKKNTLHPKKKKKPLPNKEDKHEVASVSPRQRWNSQFDDSEADFKENEADEDNLIINVVSMANKGMALSGSTKHAKVSTKQFKSSEMHTSKGGSTENEHGEEKDLLLPKKKMKPFFAEERNGNEVVFTVSAEKGNFQTQSSGPLVTQTTGQECRLKQSSTSCSWSQKSSWRALVGDRSNSAFSLSNILQNVGTTKEKQLISDGPKVDNTLDSRNEKLAISKNLEGMSGKTEIVNVLAEAQPSQPNTASSNSGRGSSWLHKSSWMQLVSDKSNSFSISENLPGTTSTIQELTKPICEDGNYHNIMERYKTEPKIDGSTALGVRKEGDSVQSIPESNHQTVDGNKDAFLPAVENICNSEPNKGFGVDTGIGETCSFMRSSASLKEWVKTKATLKGSRKKKKSDSM
ncbi:hypothetical protein CRYUN_Cryun25bG0044700 [Craigia yunnanensis]